MSGVKIEFDVVNDTLSKGLASILDLGENPEDFLFDVGGSFVLNTQARFNVGVGPDGEVWKVSDRAESEGGKTLVKSGNLSDTTFSHNVAGSELEWGSNSVYAAIHQFGGEAGRNKSLTLPARPYLGIADEDDAIFKERFAFFFADAAAV
jgi:phage virion morphogenesis protein